MPINGFRCGIEVEYSDWVEEKIFRGRIFFTSKDRDRALVLPSYERDISNKKSWRIFDHKERLLFGFSYGYYSYLDEFIVPGTIPFTFHRVFLSRTRVKFGNRNSNAYGGSNLYASSYYGPFYREMYLRECHAKFLPEPYKAYYDLAKDKCNVNWYDKNGSDSDVF